MKRARWIIGSALACIAVAATAGGGHRGPPPAAVPSIDWASCGEFFPGLECALVEVPLDYDDPQGPTTELALARVPAADQANKIGSVFLNPGGPGGSGVSMILSGFGDFLAFQLQGRFDIIGFDPRGVANSSPMHCFETSAELDAALSGVPLFPYLPNDEQPFFDAYKSFGRSCLSHGDAITTHMSTADVVRDMDLLRQAVGDQKLTYLGFSYGSHIGNTYANMFPNKVRALVIDGVLDPRLWSSGRQIVSDRVATAKEFGEFLRLCDEAGDACSLSAGGAAVRYQSMVTSLRAQPAIFNGFLYYYDYLVADSVGAMYSPEDWGGPFGWGEYFASLSDAILGDASAGERAMKLRRELWDRHRQDTARADYDNGLDAYYGNLCSDAEFPRSLPAFDLVGNFAEQGSIYGPYWWWGNAGCAGWPASADRYAGPWGTRTSSPVLVVGNYFDGVTDYDGAVASSKLLKNSRLLSYAGWGHTAFGRSDCVTQYVIDYLLDGSLPPEGTVCPANPNPFSPPALLGPKLAQPRVPMINLMPLLRPSR